MFPFFSSAGFESPVLAPKKLDLTRENLNALLGQESFKKKTPSTLSRGSAQTSGGRGPGKTENMKGPHVFKNEDVEENTAEVSILTRYFFYSFPLQI